MALVAASKAEVLSSALRTWRSRTPPQPLPMSESGFRTGYDWRLRQAVDWAAAAHDDPASLRPGGAGLGGAHRVGAPGGGSASGAASPRRVPTPAERDALLRQLYQALTAFPGGLRSPLAPPPPTLAPPSPPAVAAIERHRTTPHPSYPALFPSPSVGSGASLPAPPGPRISLAAPSTPQTARHPDGGLGTGGGPFRPSGAWTPVSTTATPGGADARAGEGAGRGGHAGGASMAGGLDAFADSVYARAVSAAKFVSSTTRADIGPHPSCSSSPAVFGCGPPLQSSRSAAHAGYGVCVPGVFTPPLFGHGPGCTCAGHKGGCGGSGSSRRGGDGRVWSGGGSGRNGFGCGGGGVDIDSGTSEARLAGLEARRRVRIAREATRTVVAVLAGWSEVARR
jgi:hypothetical protein